jgi:hypothetical protein
MTKVTEDEQPMSLMVLQKYITGNYEAWQIANLISSLASHLAEDYL